MLELFVVANLLLHIGVALALLHSKGCFKYLTVYKET